ncbi:hypothetical protein WDZ92_52600, partial [Nostoc sp. NIES-2111]
EREPPAAEYDFSTPTIARHKQQGYLTARNLLAESRSLLSRHDRPSRDDTAVSTTLRRLTPIWADP